MNSAHHHHHHHPASHHHEHHDVHQQRLLWFFSFCNQRSSSSSSSSGGSSASVNHRGRNNSSRRKQQSASSRNKFALQYQQQLQQQQRQSSNIFGCDLTEHTSRFGGDDKIPHIVKACTRFIEKHGIIFGIYRLSGMRVNIHKLRQDFDKNPKTSMIDSEAISNDAHAVACVLKQYFRELPTPLLTFHMYEEFIELFKHSTSTGRNNNNTNNNNEIDDNLSNFDTIDGQVHSNEQDKTITTPPSTVQTCGVGDHENPNINITTTSTAATADTTTTITSDLTKSPAQQISQQNKSTAAILTSSEQQAKRQQKFTTSASDSQLISLSSVVTTTTTDVKYQVRLGDLRRLLLQLPAAHYQTLKFLMRHLACIAANGKKTGMDSKNVAIVWAPNLLKPRELELSAGLETLQVIGLQAVITEQLIKHHKFLFVDDDES